MIRIKPPLTAAEQKKAVFPYEIEQNSKGVATGLLRAIFATQK